MPEIPEYRLLYFPIKGRAEPMRLMFAHAGIPFEDVRWEMQTEWPRHKKETPFGHVPVLEYKGQQLAQSKAICQFLGQKLGLHPDDPWEAAQLLMLAEQRDDMFAPIFAAFFEPDKTKKRAMLSSAIQETVIPGVNFYENWLAKSKSGFFGSKLSWADFFLYVGFLTMRDVFHLDLTLVPHIAAFVERIGNLPNVKKFNDEHPNVPHIPPQPISSKL